MLPLMKHRTTDMCEALKWS